MEFESRTFENKQCQNRSFEEEKQSKTIKFNETSGWTH